MESSASSCCRASSRRRRKYGLDASGSAASGGIVIRPRAPGCSRRNPSSSSGARPDFVSSPERLTPQGRAPGGRAGGGVDPGGVQGPGFWFHFFLFFRGGGAKKG